MEIINNNWIEKLSENFNLKIKEIVSVWIDIGVVGDKYVSRVNTLSQHISQLLDDMLKEENKHRLDLQKDVKRIIEEISILSKILKIDVNIPIEENLLKNEEKLLSIKIKLLSIKDDRIKRYNDLINMEKDLCERLFEIREEFDPDLIPTEEELNEMNKYIEKLQMEKTARQDSFIKKRIQVLEYFKLLEKTISKDIFIEKVLKDEFAEVVPLSKGFLHECDLFIKQLSDEYEQNKEECIKLRNRYLVLHSILYPNISESSFSEYATKDSIDFRCKTLEKLQYDVSILEKNRHDKMEEFIHNYQKKIKDKLHMNFLSHFEKKDPHKSLLNSRNYNEELLDKLEHEFNDLVEVEKQVSPIQNEINNWNTYFTKLIHLKLQLKDPNVLKNRGGILLKVEKEKKVVNKELPKCESKIKSLLNSLKSTLIAADDLLIEDMKILDYLLHQWNNMDGDKENEKKNTLKSELSKSILMKTSVIQKKLLPSKINEVLQSNNASTDLSNNIQKQQILSKINNVTLNIIPSKVQDCALKKTSFKIPQLKKIPKKVLPISPIHIQLKSSLNKRFSRSCTNLNTPKFIKSNLMNSNKDLYGMFCREIEPGVETSSFIGHIPY